MSTLVSTDYAVRLMREHELKYWKLRDADGKSVIGEQKSEDVDLDASIRRLEDTLNELTGRYVLLELRSRSAKERGSGGDLKSGIFDLRVKLEGVSGIGNTSASGQNFNTSLFDRISALEKQLIEERYQNKMERLQDQINELKDGNPMLTQVIGTLGNMFSNQGKTVEAAPVAPVLGSTDKKPNRLKAAIIRLAKIDNDPVGTLEALAAFAEKNPDQYNGYLSMLKSQV